MGILGRWSNQKTKAPSSGPRLYHYAREKLEQLKGDKALASIFVAAG